MDTKRRVFVLPNGAALVDVLSTVFFYTAFYIHEELVQILRKFDIPPVRCWARVEEHSFGSAQIDFSRAATKVAGVHRP
jgi:hypothetical protein